jgi:hypothetical protein
LTTDGFASLCNGVALTDTGADTRDHCDTRTECAAAEHDCNSKFHLFFPPVCRSVLYAAVLLLFLILETDGKRCFERTFAADGLTIRFLRD